MTSETKAEAKAEVAALQLEVSTLHAEEEALIREVAALRQQVSQHHAEEEATNATEAIQVASAAPPAASSLAQPTAHGQLHLMMEDID